MNSFHLRNWIIAGLAALGLPGCATVPTSSSQQAPHLSSRAVLLDIPFTSQKRPNFCGLAAVEMVTDYYGQKLSTAQSQALRHEAEAQDGVSGASLKKVLEEAGYFAVVFPGTLDRSDASLYNHLDEKRPLIVMLGSGRRHYMVVTGYDPELSVVFLLDPGRGHVGLPAAEFEKIWAQANHFTLLAFWDKADSKP